jgi:Transposase IS116/IS110/IS902 family
VWTHGQHTNRQDNWPEIGTTIAYKPPRPGGAARFAEPAVHKRVAVDLALGDYDAPRLRALALVKTAPPQDANPLDWLQTVPGIGTLLSRVLVDERHDLTRFPRGQDGVSSGRLGQCAQDAAGKRSGPSGTQSGNASLPWAWSAAAVLCLRTTPAGPKLLARFEKKPGPGPALPVGAPQRARAVSDRVPRRGGGALATWLQRAGRGAGALATALGHAGRRLAPGRCPEAPRAAPNAQEHRGALPCPGAWAWTPARAPVHRAQVPAGDCVLPLPRPCASLAHTDVPPRFCLGR